MRAISTFSGLGGSSLGYRNAGFKMLACVEWDRHAVDSYKLNHPSTRIYHEDITKISPSRMRGELGLEVGELDLLDGSPPCQGFSSAGKREFNDPRNHLFWSHLRLIEEFQPRAIVVENVAGLIRGKMKRHARAIQEALESQGYEVIVGLVKATCFGVPSYRPRTFFIGLRSDLGISPAFPPVTHDKYVSCSEALKGVAPVTMPNSPGKNTQSEFLRKNLLPGECGEDVWRRLRINKTGSFGVLKIHPRKPAFTVIKSCTGYWHWTHRHISLEEALVLTGFPSDYRIAPAGFRKKWERIGNSVAPPVAEAIGRQLIRQLGGVHGSQEQIHG